MFLRRSILLVLLLFLFSAGALAQGTITDESETFASARAVLVPPVEKTDTTNLVDIGVMEVNGYDTLTLNFAGATTDVVRTGGTIGVILIPAIELFERAFQNQGLLPASLEIAAAVSAGGMPEFMAKQVKVDVGFPRYRVLLYNTTSNAANVYFFVLRSNR
jgi:hypothetical protein